MVAIYISISNQRSKLFQPQPWGWNIYDRLQDGERQGEQPVFEKDKVVSTHSHQKHGMLKTYLVLALALLSKFLNVSRNSLAPEGLVGVEVLKLLTLRLGQLGNRRELLHMLLVYWGRSLDSTGSPLKESLRIIAQRLVTHRSALLLDCVLGLFTDLAEHLLVAGGDVEVLVEVGNELREDILDQVVIVLVDSGIALVLLANLIMELFEELDGLEADGLGDLLASLGEGGKAGWEMGLCGDRGRDQRGDSERE